MLTDHNGPGRPQRADMYSAAAASTRKPSVHTLAAYRQAVDAISRADHRRW